MIECQYCKTDTKKRILVEKKPLKKLGLAENGLDEFLCINTIKVRHKYGRDSSGTQRYKWYIEECRNHIFVKKTKKKPQKSIKRRGIV